MKITRHVSMGFWCVCHTCEIDFICDREYVFGQWILCRQWIPSWSHQQARPDRIPCDDILLLFFIKLTLNRFVFFFLALFLSRPTSLWWLHWFYNTKNVGKNVNLLNLFCLPNNKHFSRAEQNVMSSARLCSYAKAMLLIILNKLINIINIIVVAVCECGRTQLKVHRV